MATRIYKTPFAATGDKEDLATSDQPDGKVSLQSGWTPDYELPNDNANYRPVGRLEMNGILSEVTQGLGEVQLNGFAKWQAIDGGWPLGAWVSQNGTVYVSTVDNNTATPGAAGSGWQIFSAVVPSPVTHVYNASTTWTKPTSPYFRGVFVRVVGSGGAGGGANTSTGTQASCGGGGGGGGYTEKWIPAASLAATVAVTVGVGGVGVAADSGGAGNSSSFGPHCSATGGLGGSFLPLGTSAAQSISGRGGVGSGGDVNVQGGSGMGGLRFSGTAAFAGFSGATPLCGSDTSVTGITPVGIGGGGSGVATTGGQTFLPGANGNNGGVIVREVYL